MHAYYKIKLKKANTGKESYFSKYGPIILYYMQTHIHIDIDI